MLETTDCPVCNSSQNSRYLNSCDYLISKENYCLVKCDVCNLVYTNPRISEQAIGDYYASDYTSYAINQENKLKQRVKNLTNLFYTDENQKIAILLRKHNVRTVLELGPGNGGLIKYLHKDGFNVTGIELDQTCVERIKAAGITCHHGTLECVKDKLHKYDAVIMCQVLEHVYHPNNSLKIIHSLLSDNGLLYISVPNIDSVEARLFGKYWRGLDLPRHISHFSPDTLGNLLDKTGYVINTMNSMTFPSSFIESLAFLITKKGRFPNVFYYLLYYIWKLLCPLHRAVIGSGILEVVAKKGHNENRK